MLGFILAPLCQFLARQLVRCHANQLLWFNYLFANLLEKRQILAILYVEHKRAIFGPILHSRVLVEERKQLTLGLLYKPIDLILG
uniref:Putative secreted protein n=1 Tax=Anopheles marajoara TaxID=58244 RepID=A0A2M4CB16_9DIPT